MKPFLLHGLLLCGACGLSYWLGVQTGPSLPKVPFARSTPPAPSPAAPSPRLAAEETLSGRSLGSSGGDGPQASNLRSTLIDALGDLDSPNRLRRLETLGGQYGSSNPQEGLGLLSSIPGLGDRQAFAEALVTQWCKSDLRAALSACDNLAAGDLKAGAFAAAVGAWAETSPIAASDWAATELTGGARALAVQRAVSIWAREDPQAAASWAVKHGDRGVALAATGAVMTHWANTDPLTGAEWAAALPPGGFRDHAMDSILVEWADQFPAEAAQWAAAQPDSAVLLTQVAGAWAASDPEAAARWALTSSSGGPGEELILETITASWAGLDPHGALDWIQSVQEPARRSNLQSAALTTWSDSDPAGAFAWSQRLPPGEMRQQIEETILQNWASSDPDTLAQWIEAQPEGTSVDPALHQLAFSQVDATPQAAAETALAIRDPSVKLEVLRQVHATWREAEPEAADRWLASQPALVRSLAP